MSNYLRVTDASIRLQSVHFNLLRYKMFNSIKHALFRHSRRDPWMPGCSIVADHFPPTAKIMNPKSFEWYIIREVLAGNMKFRHYRTSEVCCDYVDNYRCGHIHFKIEHPSLMEGDVSYGYIDGVDVSNCSTDDFDLRRVITVVRTGRDPGETKLTPDALYHL